MTEFRSATEQRENQVSDLNEQMWIVQNLRENWDYISLAAERHGVDVEAIAAATIIENMSDLNRILQDELGGNWWQDLLAVSANTFISSDEILYFICIAALGKAAYSSPVNRRAFLGLMVGVAIASVMTTSLTKWYSTPSAGKIIIPETIAQYVDTKSNLLAQLVARRSKEGIWVERSIGVSAIKPFEIQRIVGNSSITITNPWTNEPIDRNTWENILIEPIEKPLVSGVIGGPVSVWLGLLSSNSKWSYELAAARMELAKIMYSRYREQYNQDWQDVTQPLPEFTALSDRDRQQYLVWATAIAKGYPHELFINGKVSGFAAMFESEKVTKLHPLDVDWPINQLKTLGILT